jgi:hypothetical protein
LSFRSDVITRIPPVGDCPTFVDEPAVQVLIALGADSDRTIVTVHVAYRAAYRTAADPVGQGEGCLLPTAPIITGTTPAKLSALGGINAV